MLNLSTEKSDELLETLENSLNTIGNINGLDYFIHKGEIKLVPLPKPDAGQLNARFLAGAVAFVNANKGEVNCVSVLEAGIVCVFGPTNAHGERKRLLIARAYASNPADEKFTQRSAQIALLTRCEENGDRAELLAIIKSLSSSDKKDDAVDLTAQTVILEKREGVKEAVKVRQSYRLFCPVSFPEIKWQPLDVVLSIQKTANDWEIEFKQILEIPADNSLRLQIAEYLKKELPDVPVYY